MEQIDQFEQRKRDHLRIALDPKSQSSLGSGLERIDLVHEALPDLNFSDIDVRTELFGKTVSAPFFVSSMTAGHENGRHINFALARLSHRRQILMGVGSQRRELNDSSASLEWKELRAQAPEARLAGNLGISQLIQTSPDSLQKLVDDLQAEMLFVHLNALQECLQPEGTPQFRGGLQALEAAAKTLSVPVVVKEVGCGFSAATLKRLESTGVKAVDVSGLGGTHWGRVEEQRLGSQDPRRDSAALFADWGISTVDSLLNAQEARVSYQLWASGGVRHGLHVAKLIALGAKFVGLAKPWLEAALEKDADAALEREYQRLLFELKTSLFCTGSRTLKELQQPGRWSWRKN